MSSPILNKSSGRCASLACLVNGYPHLFALHFFLPHMWHWHSWRCYGMNKNCTWKLLLSQQQKSGSYPSPPPAVRSQLRLIEYETIGASKHLGLIALCKLAMTAAAAVIFAWPKSSSLQERCTIAHYCENHYQRPCPKCLLMRWMTR